jgi:hypothetical protein
MCFSGNAPYNSDTMLMQLVAKGTPGALLFAPNNARFFCERLELHSKQLAPIHNVTFTVVHDELLRKLGRKNRCSPVRHGGLKIYVIVLLREKKWVPFTTAGVP